MENLALQGIIINLALLSLLLSVYTLIPLRKVKKHYNSQVLFGIGTGIIGFLIMSIPIEVAEGVFLDTRNILISTVGFFYGIIPTLVTVIITSIYRINVGGIGTVTGVLGIITTGLLGIIFRYFRYEKIKHSDFWDKFFQLYILGIIVVVFDLLSYFFIPFDLAFESIRVVSIPTLLIYPIAIAIVGNSIYQKENNYIYQCRLKESENKYKILSYYDHLTGLKNRRYFEEILLELDNNENLPLSIIIGDVNGLKFMNDTFGHKSGDEILIRTAKVFKETFNTNQIVSRYSGDEFVILLPNTNSTHCENLIFKVKERLEKEYVKNVKVSISFGYASKNRLNINIAEIIKNAEDNMYREKMKKDPEIRAETIDTILTTLYEKDIYSEEHSERVSHIAKEIGIGMGLNSYDIMKLKTAGLLHDIGKITISSDILNKNGALTENEYTEMKKHPEIGYRILKSSKNSCEISNFILKHHERWDGFGYPYGLTGDEIPIQSRVIAVADAYDAMTSKRTYRDSLSDSEAINELIKNSGTQFDPYVVDIFVNKVIKNTNWKSTN